MVSNEKAKVNATVANIEDCLARVFLGRVYRFMGLLFQNYGLEGVGYVGVISQPVCIKLDQQSWQQDTTVDIWSMREECWQIFRGSPSASIP